MRGMAQHVRRHCPVHALQNWTAMIRDPSTATAMWMLAWVAAWAATIAFATLDSIAGQAVLCRSEQLVEAALDLAEAAGDLA